MNSYSKAIAVEMQVLKNKGADIPDHAIEKTKNGAWSFGLKACDLFKDKFDCSKLSKLCNQASREEYPKYWADVDKAGGFKKGDENYSHNLNVLKKLFS